MQVFTHTLCAVPGVGGVGTARVRGTRKAGGWEHLFGPFIDDCLERRRINDAVADDDYVDVAGGLAPRCIRPEGQCWP